MQKSSRIGDVPENPPGFPSGEQIHAAAPCSDNDLSVRSFAKGTDTVVAEGAVGRGKMSESVGTGFPYAQPALLRSDPEPSVFLLEDSIDGASGQRGRIGRAVDEVRDSQPFGCKEQQPRILCAEQNVLSENPDATLSKLSVKG